MALPQIDVKSLTDAEVRTLCDLASLEIQRRIRVGAAAAQVDDISQTYLKDTGRVTGAAWVQPTAALDAYPIGWKVTYGGKTWESLIGANTTKPGDTTDPQNYRWWKDLTTVVTPGAWDGNGHAYKVGDIVTYQGVTYKVIQAHTSQAGWTPPAVPALYAVA